MSNTLPIIQTAFSSGVTVYAILRNSLNGQVWNGGAFEAYNVAHWASYAITLAEQSSSGVYIAARPAGVAGFLVSEAFYQQAGGSPASSDAPPYLLGQSGGVNVAAIAGDASAAPTNLESALKTETQGAVAAGTITAGSFPTNLTNTNAGAYQGLTIRFITGAAAGMAGLIANYTVASGVITLSGSLAVAPSAADLFIIV